MKAGCGGLLSSVQELKSVRGNHCRPLEQVNNCREVTSPAINCLYWFRLDSRDPEDNELVVGPVVELVVRPV